MRFIKCVGARSLEEAKNIFICEPTKENVCGFVMPNGFQDDFPDKFPFKNDPEAMKKIKQEATEGPFVLLVIFYEEKE